MNERISFYQSEATKQDAKKALVNYYQMAGVRKPETKAIVALAELEGGVPVLDTYTCFCGFGSNMEGTDSNRRSGDYLTRDEYEEYKADCSIAEAWQRDYERGYCHHLQVTRFSDGTYIVSGKTWRW